MDIDLQKRINDVVEELNSISETRIDFMQMDPVAKMMLVALMSEAQKINDKVDAMEERLVERYCEHFIPRKLVDAMPALLLLAPQFKPNKDTETVNIGSNVQFSYKRSASASQLYPYFQNNSHSLCASVCCVSPLYQDGRRSPADRYAR